MAMTILSLDSRLSDCSSDMRMKQRFHTIIKPERNGWFVGWVEEVPGTITQGRSLQECRRNLRDALELMLETNRHEARLPLDESCIQEPIEIESIEVSEQELQLVS